MQLEIGLNSGSGSGIGKGGFGFGPGFGIGGGSFKKSGTSLNIPADTATTVLIDTTATVFLLNF
jgi:hypothetical protein